MERTLTKEVLLGAGAGYAAGKVMDQVTAAFMDRQSPSSLAREKELQDEPSYQKAAERLADVAGTDLDDEQAQQLGQGLHVGLGVTGGAVAGTLAARGVNPLAAGILSGLGLWLFVDEGANAALGLTPPAPEFPRETHLRGLVGHLAYGAALGAILGVGNLFLRRRP